MASKAISVEITGGGALERHMRTIERNLGRGAHLRVGFLEDASYPAAAKGQKKLHVAQVAFWNIKGTVRTPARDFMGDMVRKKSPRWGVSLGRILKRVDYNAEKALALMGEGISDQLRDSIRNWAIPPNAPSTIAKKGFNKPLIETALMLRSVDYQVVGALHGDDE